MKKYLFNLIVLGISAIFSMIIIGNTAVQAVSEVSNIEYPVKELGDCASEKECKVFCDKTENVSACLSFAEKNNLMSKEEIKIAKKFANNEIKGPGGCNGKDECDSYCNSMDNIDECISFAEKNNLMPDKELKEAKKVQAAIKKGIKPPACNNKAECDVFCEDPNHMEECINFGVEAGFIQGKELEDAQKMLSALKRGVKPLPCRGKDSCDEYCQSPDNIEACVNFAIETGMMNEEEKENSQKMLQAIKKGVKPPNCKGKEECDAYCGSEENIEECINFSVAAGMMSEKEAEMAKKTKGKGPGGCKNKDECDAFCGNPDNQETCFQFGKENGMIPEADLQKMEQEKENFGEFSPNNNNEFIPKQDDFNRPEERGEIMPTDQVGPGGCKTKEECDSFCRANPSECQKFQPAPGIRNLDEQMIPQQEQQIINQFNQPNDQIRQQMVNPNDQNNWNNTEPGFNFQQPVMQQPPIGSQQPNDQMNPQFQQEQQPIMEPFQPNEPNEPNEGQLQSNIQKQSLIATALSAFLSLFK